MRCRLSKLFRKAFLVSLLLIGSGINARIGDIQALIII
jgi:hypothetical protein